MIFTHSFLHQREIFGVLLFLFLLPSATMESRPPPPPPPQHAIRMTKLADGARHCTSAAGPASRLQLLRQGTSSTKKLGRPRGRNHRPPTKSRLGTSNAGAVPTQPPPLLATSMTELLDGACRSTPAVPASTSADGPEFRLRLLRARALEMKKLRRPESRDARPAMESRPKTSNAIVVYKPPPQLATSTAVLPATSAAGPGPRLALPRPRASTTKKLGRPRSRDLKLPMESRPKTSDAGAVPTPPPSLATSMSKLPDGTCCDAPQPSLRLALPRPRAAAAKESSRPRSQDLKLPTESSTKTSDAGVVPTPPPCLAMNMTKVPDGTCHGTPVVPSTSAVGPGFRLRLLRPRASAMKKQGSRRKHLRIAAAPAGSAIPVPVMGSADDGLVGGDVPFEIVMPFADLGSRNNSFVPYTIEIKAGQDITCVLNLFREHGHTCVLSAKGLVSQASLQQAANSDGIITYEGQFEILLLSGLLSKSSETGGLSIVLAGPNGRFFGGRLAGSLIAASHVRVVVGRLTGDGC